ncbi:MAG: hypothetical protein ABI451_10800 [Dokdonella sp.]
MRNLWQRLCRLVGVAGQRGSLRWQTLTEAKESEFFRWFSFTHVGTATNEQRKQVFSFRPSGEKFHYLVRLDILLDQGERIEMLRLFLAASFVDDVREGLFARDIARSFLLSAVLQSDECSLENLANEIAGRHNMPVITRSLAADLTVLPSAGFLAFVGQGPRYEKSCSSIHLSIERTKSDVGDLVTMSIGHAGGNSQ